MKTLAELQRECTALGIEIATKGRADKRPYVDALRDYHWQQDHPGDPLPPQIAPMLLDHWDDLDPEQAKLIENDGPGWVVSPKLDGVRAILNVEGGRVRLTSRCVSEVTYRLGEFQDNLTHLTVGLSGLDGTILDGELVFPGAILDTGRTIARHPLQAATAILSTSPEQALRLQAQAENRLRFHAFDVQQGSDAVQLGLDDPAGTVFDASGFFGVEVGPVVQEHGMDLRRDGLVGVLLVPVVGLQGGDVRFLALSPLGGHVDPEGGACSLQFGQVFQGVLRWWKGCPNRAFPLPSVPL